MRKRDRDDYDDFRSRPTTPEPVRLVSYRSSDTSPWMAVPRMTKGALWRFLNMGTYAFLRYSDGTVEART